VTGALSASADMQPAMPPPFCFFCRGRPGTGSLTADAFPRASAFAPYAHTFRWPSSRNSALFSETSTRTVLYTSRPCTLAAQPNPPSHLHAGARPTRCSAVARPPSCAADRPRPRDRTLGPRDALTRPSQRLHACLACYRVHSSAHFSARIAAERQTDTSISN
jgi:hypothetical protein